MSPGESRRSFARGWPSSAFASRRRTRRIGTCSSLRSSSSKSCWRRVRKDGCEISSKFCRIGQSGPKKPSASASSYAAAQPSCVRIASKARSSSSTHGTLLRWKNATCPGTPESPTSRASRSVCADREASSSSRRHASISWPSLAATMKTLSGSGSKKERLIAARSALLSAYGPCGPLAGRPVRSRTTPTVRCRPAISATASW